jgi:LmbE family N-acetylglucosaminyl deacetylase
LNADLSGRSLLAVFAHPDDESIACGGLLAYCADRGVRVSLICATHGENNRGVRDPNLYEQRPRELDEAARILGISEVILYEYADGFLPWLAEDEFRPRLAADIRRLRPDVVITFGEDGLYWHPDHIAVHLMTTAVVAALDTEAPSLYYVTMPPGLMRTVVDGYVAEPPERGVLTPLLGMANPDAFGVSCKPPTLVVDVSRWGTRKLAALKCHRTQVNGGALALIPDEDGDRVFPVEHFHRAAVGSRCPGFIEQL